MYICRDPPGVPDWGTAGVGTFLGIPFFHIDLRTVTTQVGRVSQAEMPFRGRLHLDCLAPAL